MREGSSPAPHRVEFPAIGDLQDPTTVPLEARLRPVFALVQKLTLAPAKVTQADIDTVAAVSKQRLLRRNGIVDQLG